MYIAICNVSQYLYFACFHEAGGDGISRSQESSMADSWTIRDAKSPGFMIFALCG
jgi:hypothetical protein